MHTFALVLEVSTQIMLLTSLSPSSTDGGNVEAALGRQVYNYSIIFQVSLNVPQITSECVRRAC